MKLAPIGECIEKVRSWSPARDSAEQMIDYIDLGAVDNEHKVVVGSQSVIGREAPSRARQKVIAGDILVSTVRPYLNGVARVPKHLDGATASTGFCVLRPSTGKIDPAYLFQWVKSPEFVTDMVRKSTGASYPAVSDRIICDSLVPLPPLPEQRRITAILDQADALRRLRRRSLSRLSDLGQAIFFEMFGDAASDQRSWPTIRLGDLCSVGSSKRVFVSEFAESGIPFYRGTEVGELGAGKPIDPDLFISTQHYESLIAESGRPEIGDLLLPSICHDGRIWLVNDDRPFYFKDGRVLWIKSANAEIDGEYLRRHLQGMFLRDYSKIASGTTFAELKIVNLKSLPILYPPLDLQRQFAQKMSALERTRGDSLGAIDMIDSLFTSLQHRAFRGEL